MTTAEILASVSTDSIFRVQRVIRIHQVEQPYRREMLSAVNTELGHRGIVSLVKAYV